MIKLLDLLENTLLRKMMLWIHYWMGFPMEMSDFWEVRRERGGMVLKRSEKRVWGGFVMVKSLKGWSPFLGGYRGFLVKSLYSLCDGRMKTSSSSMISYAWVPLRIDCFSWKAMSRWDLDVRPSQKEKSY